MPLGPNGSHLPGFLAYMYKDNWIVLWQHAYIGHGKGCDTTEIRGEAGSSTFRVITHRKCDVLYCGQQQKGQVDAFHS